MKTLLINGDFINTEKRTVEQNDILIDDGLIAGVIPRGRFSKSENDIQYLDISGKVISYDPISLPPHMLFRTAEITEDWFIFSGKHRVHVPGRVIEKGK